MGNQLIGKIDSKTRKKTKLFKSCKSKPVCFKSNLNEDFIIKHQQCNKNQKIIIKSLDKRVVFVSLIGIFKTWQQCPSFILYTCLLILPLKQKWIYAPAKYISEIKDSFLSETSCFSDVSQIIQFIKLLKFKDAQGLVIWMSDDYKMRSAANNYTLTAPLWYYVSQKLTNLYDPITSQKYEPLHLDKKYWKNKKKCTYKYGVKTSGILGELIFVTMKFKSIQEIIYDSNPNSLIPMTAYVDVNDGSSSATIYDEFDDEEVTDNWWVSPDYDPYDLDDNSITVSG